MAKSTIEIVEIFAVGKWNGINFTTDDLEDIVDNFDALFDVHKVPLKFGHNDKQAMSDGQPSIGWVESIWLDGSKLFAKFVDMPTVVLEAINKKLYRKVSIELDRDVTYKGDKFKSVLSGVALLGADLPAVNVLADLTAYMSTKRSLSFGKRVYFSAINIGDNTMSVTVEDLQAQLAKEKLEREKDKLEFATNKLATDQALADFKKSNEERKKLEKEKTIKLKREEVTKLLEDAVKDNRITPAIRDSYHAMFKIDTDDVVNVSVDHLKTQIGVGKVENFSKDDSARSQGDSSDDSDKPVDVQLTDLTHKFMAEHGEKDFETAMFAVMKANPELSKAWKFSNGEYAQAKGRK